MPEDETESDYRREFRASSWATCIRLRPFGSYGETGRLHSRRALHLALAKRRRAIKDIMKAQGIPDFQAPPPIPKFIDTAQAMVRQAHHKAMNFLRTTHSSLSC